MNKSIASQLLSMAEVVLWYGHICGTDLLVFIDDMTADKSSRMNSRMYKATVSAQIQTNASKLTG